MRRQLTRYSPFHETKSNIKPGILTQSNAFASLAHTKGHARGVIALGFKKPAKSSSMLRFLPGVVVEEQEIQEAAEDVKAPF